PRPPTRRQRVTALMTTDPNRTWSGQELAAQLQINPHNLLTQLAEWSPLGFLAHTDSGTYAPNTPPANTSSTNPPAPHLPNLNPARLPAQGPSRPPCGWPGPAWVGANQINGQERPPGMSRRETPPPVPELQSWQSFKPRSRPTGPPLPRPGALNEDCDCTKGQ